MPRRTHRANHRDATRTARAVAPAPHHRRRLARPPGSLPARRARHPPHARSRPGDAVQLAAGSQSPALRCLDLFAGSGALGLEALSRGAARSGIRRVGAGRPAWHRRDAQTPRVQPWSRSDGDACAVPARSAQPFDVVFLDPPFASGVARTGCAALAAADGSRPARASTWSAPTRRGSQRCRRAGAVAQQARRARWAIISPALTTTWPPPRGVRTTHGQPRDVPGDVRPDHQRSQRPRAASLPHLRQGRRRDRREPEQGAAVLARSARRARAHGARRRAERRGLGLHRV